MRSSDQAKVTRPVSARARRRTVLSAPAVGSSTVSLTCMLTSSSYCCSLRAKLYSWPQLGKSRAIPEHLYPRKVAISNQPVFLGAFPSQPPMTMAKLTHASTEIHLSCFSRLFPFKNNHYQ